MSEYDFGFEQVDPRDVLLEDISHLGISPEYLAGLEPKVARRLVAGVVIAWSRILHDDVIVSAEIISESNHLPHIGNVNNTGTEFSRLSDEDTSSLLARASTFHGRILDAIAADRDKSQSRIRELNLTKIEEIVHPEWLVNRYSGAMLLEPRVDSLGSLSLKISEGTVIEAHTIEPEASLYSRLPAQTRQALESLRSSIDEPEALLYVNDAGKVIVKYEDEQRVENSQEHGEIDLPEGWYELVNATSKIDASKKALAVKVISQDNNNGGTIKETSLKGTRLLGAYTYNESDRAMPYLLDQESLLGTSRNTASNAPTLSMNELLNFLNDMDLDVDIRHWILKSSQIIVFKPSSSGSIEHGKARITGYLRSMT